MRLPFRFPTPPPLESSSTPSPPLSLLTGRGGRPWVRPGSQFLGRDSHYDTLDRPGVTKGETLYSTDPVSHP